ncbi:hypothetical protein ES332_A10G227300v1 [Gossypium tomentosum]|uniref:Hydrophobic seed protein domain-containing protein n=1 Tax=Gossypium tomentosum TaxID=34277 RepID=A0A5D2NWK6_GOSTO|nr:hypothetical protein ES332_A10G227300v1 [Gossypium tomentosum]
MASHVKASSALFFSLNLFFFALVSSYNVDNNSNGSFYPKKSRNPVVIRPGYKFPNDGSSHSQGFKLRLIHGLADLEAAVCLCTPVRANVLDIKLSLPISLSLLLNNCGRRVAAEYICAP